MKRREFLKVAGTFALVASASALTGCGGSSDSGNSGSGSGGNGGTGGGSGGASGEKPSGEPGSSSGTGDSGTTKPEKLTYKDTKTAAYFARKGVTATNFYMEGTVQGNWSGKVLLAASGENVRYRKFLTKERVTTGWNILIQKETAYDLNDVQKQYKLYAYEVPSDWTEKQIRSAVLRFRQGEGHFCVPSGDEVSEIKETKAVVNGQTYDAESMFIATEKSGNSYNGYRMTFCFEGEELRYVIDLNGSISTIRAVHPNPDPSLMKLPVGEYTEMGKDEIMFHEWEF